MNTLEIRLAKAADAHDLTELAKVAKASWSYPAEWLHLWAEDLSLTPQYITSHHALTAELNRVIVGVCVLEDRGEFWQMEHVWVHPSVQGQGIGRALLVEALAKARATRGGAVRVLSDPFAEAFYVRLGAHKIQDVPAPMPGAPERVLPLLEFIV